VFVYASAEWATPTNHVNQAMVWARIVEQRRGARIKEVMRIEYPYALTDQGADPHSICSWVALVGCLRPNNTEDCRGRCSCLQPCRVRLSWGRSPRMSEQQQALLQGSPEQMVCM